MTSRSRAHGRIRTALPTLALAVLAPLALLAGCGSDPAADPSGDGSPSASPSSQWPTINPCDGLESAPVARALGAPLKVEKGTTANARCALLPVRRGGPTYEINYLWFPGGLEAAWKTLKSPPGTVETPKVAGADAARLVVYRTRKALYVSGFVQNGALIQSFNGLALAPYDAGRMRHSALVLLAQLSANAPAPGTTSPSAGESPST